MDFSNLANFGITLDQGAFNLQDTKMAGPLEESQLTDDFVVNMVDGMENFDLPTIDYDQLKLAPVEMYTNLVPLENQFEMTTWTPMNVAPEDLKLSAPSPSFFEISENSLFSPSVASPASPASSVGSESPGSIISAASPCTTEESITLVVSTAEFFGEQQQLQAPLKKKRGRKPKSENGPISRQKRQRKVKVYEIDQPYEDRELERKRLNAVNAKRHRDLQKQAKDLLEQQLKDVIAERDSLKKEVETLRVKESDLTNQLEMFKNHLKNQHQSVVMLLQSTPEF